VRCRACVARIVKKRRLCANRRVSPEKRRLCDAGVWSPEKWRMCAEGVCRQEEKVFVRLGMCVVRRMKLCPVRGEMASFIANGGAPVTAQRRRWSRRGADDATSRLGGVIVDVRRTFERGVCALCVCGFVRAVSAV